MNVSEILGQLITPSADVSIGSFALALVVAAAAGWIVSLYYQTFYENRATGSQIHRAFLLIAPSTAALFVAIRYSLPLSLGLVGALTIIRFRTPIKEPEEIAFLMLVIAASIIAATFQFVLVAVLLALALAVLLLQRYLPRLFHGSRRADGVILLTVDGSLAEVDRALIEELLAREASGASIQSISYGSDVTSIQCSFRALRNGGTATLESEVRGRLPLRKLSVFYNRSGLI